MLYKEAKKILSDNKKDLLRLGVRALSLFGSIAKNEGSVTRDIDILIDFDSKKGLFIFIDLKNYLEDLLVVLNKNSWSNFGVKAARIDDRKLLRIALIRSNLRSLRSSILESFHARNYLKNFY